MLWCFMVRFVGKIRRDYEEKVIKLRDKQASIIFLISLIILEPVGIGVALISNSTADLYKLIFYGIIILILILLLFVTTKFKINFFEWDFDITIDNEIIKIVWNHQNGVVTTKPINKIKKVVDYGAYYYLFVFRWEASHGIICQKDLLVEGSLEEFEKIFAGKIKKNS